MNSSGSKDRDWVEGSLLVSIEIGRAEANAGQLDSAEERFHGVLALTRGSGSTAEMEACSSLVTIYSREQRDFETLPMARRLVAQARLAGNSTRLCKGLAAIVGALNDIDDYVRVEAALDALEAAIPALPSPEQVPYWRVAYGTRSDVALSRGDLEGAVVHLENLHQLFGDEATPREQGWLALNDAHVALHLGQPRRARERLEVARQTLAPSAIGGLAIEFLSVWCALETEGALAARVDAEQTLMRLSSRALDAYGNSQKVRYVPRIADLLRERCDAPDLARVAYDVAGAAAIARISQIDRFVREVPVEGGLTADDRIAFAEYRLRFKRQQISLLRSVASLVRSLHRSQLQQPLQPEVGADAVLICAWCERLCADGRVWVPIGHYLAETPELVVNHGICPACVHLLDSEPPSSDPPSSD